MSGINLNLSAKKFVPRKKKLEQQNATAAQTTTPNGPAISEDEVKQEIAKIETEENEVVKESANIIFIGHVDAGKSTTSGNILFQSGNIEQRIIDKFEKEAKENQRESWWLAYIMDQIEEEKSKGITIDVGRALFETEKRRYTILDAPGHRSFVPNMISAAAQADIAVLIVSARKGEFETGFDKGGQTREHSQLCRTAGVKTVIIAVNKMDEKTVGWEKSRYDEIVNKVKPFLRQCGFSDIYSIPISGFSGLNLTKRLDKGVCSWYDGPCLVELLDSIKLVMGNPNGPIRMPIIDKFKDGKGNSVIMGKVESGTIYKGSKSVVMPNKVDLEVTGITYDENSVPASKARPGDNVRIQMKGDQADSIQTGFVLCSPSDVCHFTNLFQAQLVVLELPRPLLTPGYEAVIHIHTSQEEVVITKITDQFDRSGKLAKKNPPFLRSGSVGNVVIKTAKPICIEPYELFPQLGRFTLRDAGKTIAFGKIIRIHGGK
uniref:Guanine nucleotide regulatory protein, putative n=1 Tax=Entamoeba histolytica TaxID=5759 RepID=S0AZI0_ENTHI|nr:guanine nucleotide regulatory protein, putative [Entamoeba histolytica]